MILYNTFFGNGTTYEEEKEFERRMAEKEAQEEVHNQKQFLTM